MELSAALLELEDLLRGTAIGALAATGVQLFRAGRGRSIGVAGPLFALSVIAYVLNNPETTRGAIGAIYPVVWALSLAGVGYFWLFIVSLFEDRPLSWRGFVPAAILSAVGVVGAVVPSFWARGVWVVHNLIEAGMAIHALWLIVGSSRGDLVEARRRLRGPFLAAVTVFIVVLSGFEIASGLGVYAPWLELAEAAAVASASLAGAALMLEARSALFGATRQAAGAARPGDDQGVDRAADHAADHAALARLDAAMGAGEAWRREGLTIGALAEEVGLPEHRLRVLINDRLGHRNFAAFLNARRIEAAKTALADAGQARKTVAAIAFDLGYGSLGPFNRAFKDATGLTPTQWRAQARAGGSPISENPG